LSHPSIEALLVDLGGVIMGLDWDRCYASWARDSGETLETIRARCKFDLPYRRHERNEIAEHEYYASLRESLGIALTDAQFAAGWCDIFADEIGEAVDALRAARGRLPIYAFSNTCREHHAVWSRKYEQALRVFDKVYVSHELGMRKPDREAFHHIAREIGVRPQRILFFDDTYENVRGALDAGLQAVHVQAPRDVDSALRRFAVIPA
jgi:putative hydrolase of the HAD superfamily